MNDKDIEQSLRSWANAAAPSPEFLARLGDIPSTHSQVRGSLMSRVIKAVGGWGFAAPQMAGLVLAAWLGVSSGTAVYAEANEPVVEQTMSAHIFGNDDLLEE